MFELDYLTQRLTFTRATDTTNPRLIGGYAPTFEGEVVELPVAIGRAARRGARRVPRRRPRRRPAGRRRRGRPVGRRDRHVAARRRRASAGRSTCPTCPRGSHSHDDRLAPVVGRRACSAARSSCRATPAATSRRARSRRGSASRGRPGRVAVVGAGKMGLPLAAQFAVHGWRVIAVDVQQARRRRDQRGPLARRRGARASRSSCATAHAGGRLRATTDGAAAARDGRRRRPDRAGDARRRAAARLPVHGRGGRRDRARASTPGRS